MNISKRSIYAFMVLAGLSSQPILARTSFHSVNVVEQSNEVRGVVMLPSGEPALGAVVKVKGTKKFAPVQADGSFVLKQLKSGQVLVVSLVGYESTTLRYTGQPIRVTLREKENVLDNAVVVGYGSVKKADVTGAISVLGHKLFKEQPVTQISDALQGRVSGVQVQNGGGPGGAVKIRVRGAGSINKSNDPLYVVDGVVREGGIDDINPEDIKSLQVLKDASSTAIYGSRGSNGVVLITTKTGVANQRKIVFDSQIGCSKVAKRFELLGAEEYAEAYNSVYPHTFSKQDIADFASGKRGTDWQDEMLQTGITQNYKLVFSDGNEKTQYYVSGNFLKEKGMVIETRKKRYQLRTNISSQLTDFIHLTADVELTHTDGRSGNFAPNKENLMIVMANYSPVTPIMGEDGYYAKDVYSALLLPNPVATMRNDNGQYRHNMVNAHFDLKFDLLKGLTFTSTNAVNFSDTKSYGFTSSKTYKDYPSRMSNADNQYCTLQSSNTLNYQGKWGKHSLNATAVFETTRYQARRMGFSKKNIFPESVGWWNANLGDSPEVNNGYSAWNLLSGVGRVMYNYDEKYLLTATLRADGSSKFFNDKWGYFPSLAVAWNLGNEDFFKRQNVVSHAKVRASVGEVGSQAIAPYATLGLLQGTWLSYDNGRKYPGYWTGTHSQLPDLTWEKTRQYDLGVDFALLNNRLSVSVDYFVKNTVDGLLLKEKPSYNGGGSNWVNAGEMQNKGVELALTARILQKEDLSLVSTFTGTYLKNEVKSLDGMPFVAGRTPAVGMIPDDGVTRAVVGKPIGSFYLYNWTGLDKDGKDTYEDVNKDGKIDANDRIITGQATPKFTLGWNSQLRYKNWNLNVFFTGAFGAKRLNLVRYTGDVSTGDYKFISWKEAWYDCYGKVENARFPDPGVTNNKSEAASTKWLENANYLRLDNVTLSYDLKRKVCKFADVRLSLSGQNLLTLTSYKGMDPAGLSKFDSGSDLNDGVDMGAYPLGRIYTLGIRFNF